MFPWVLFLIVTDMFYITQAEIVAALILARGGSKGVHLKNLQQVGGVSLLRNAVNVARGAGIDDITVSTDHPLIALEAYKSNASVFRRSYITATDFAPSIWGAAEFIHHRSDIDVLVLLQATSPFIRSSQVRDGIRKLSSSIAFDCVFSVARSYKLRWQNKNAILHPLNFDVNKRPRRQDWDGELLETGSFYIARRHLIHRGYFQNNNMSELIETITIEELEATDVITVDLVPERKGLFLKHCEYYVSSRRHGTTVTRRYNEFVQLYDVLAAKYPYRAVCRLPPKRVVVGGGSARFLRQRRAALQRWLTLAARHPVLAHDADVRAFLCEPQVRMEKPKHDEFTLAGTQEMDVKNDISIEEMEATFVSEQEQLRLMHLGLSRLETIFERAEQRCTAEMADVRELGAAFSALSTPSPTDSQRWIAVRQGMAAAAQLADVPESDADGHNDDDALILGIEALSGWLRLSSRLGRGLHAERAAAAAHAAPAAIQLRRRHRYALRAVIHESAVCRAYALRGAECAAATLSVRQEQHKRLALLWDKLHRAHTQQH